ncbi:hypothetical protein ROHU_011024 [Labeo rohita]|uniref:Uncharacterized protein n=1 Tax=Labeo rohita TaxID=84645 RepID=A0A498LW08_LABRO|nr:hypothetical protein ROHU_011024 [Labeo rohita]
MESPGAAMLARNEVKRTNRIPGQPRRNSEVKGQEHPMLTSLCGSCSDLEMCNALGYVGTTFLGIIL